MAVEERKDRIIVVGDADTASGFRLAGVGDARVAGDDAEAIVLAALAARDAGIIIVSEEVAARLSPKARRLLAESTKPVVVSVPSRSVSTSSSTSLQELVKRAIGIDLK
ncbi:MAG: V-type ATP synthase subunit F [Candidatus Micrarchaeota archaeon]